MERRGGDRPGRGGEGKRARRFGPWGEGTGEPGTGDHRHARPDSATRKPCFRAPGSCCSLRRPSRVGVSSVPERLDLLSEPSKRRRPNGDRQRSPCLRDGGVAPGTKDKPGCRCRKREAEAFALEDAEAQWPASFRRALTLRRRPSWARAQSSLPGIEDKGFGLTASTWTAKWAGYLLDPGRRAYGLEDLAAIEVSRFPPGRSLPRCPGKGPGALVVAGPGKRAG